MSPCVDSGIPAFVGSSCCVVSGPQHEVHVGTAPREQCVPQSWKLKEDIGVGAQRPH